MKPARHARITRETRKKHFESKTVTKKNSRAGTPRKEGAKPRYEFSLLEITNLKTYAPLSRTKKYDNLWTQISEAEEDTIRLEFTKFLARELVSEVKKAVHLQRFKVIYKPLSEKYAKQKKMLGRKTGFWQNTGYLIDNLTMWKVPKEDVYKVGYPKDKLHPISKTPLSHIMYILEKGSTKRNIPARPLFTPIMETIMKDVTHKFYVFLKSYRNGKYSQLIT